MLTVHRVKFKHFSSSFKFIKTRILLLHLLFILTLTVYFELDYLTLANFIIRRQQTNMMTGSF